MTEGGRDYAEIRVRPLAEREHHGRTDYAVGDRVRVRDTIHMRRAGVVGRMGTVVAARRATLSVDLDDAPPPGRYALFYDEVIRVNPEVKS